MPSLSFKSVASSLKKAPRKLFKRSSKRNKMSISSPFNIIITPAPHWLRLTAVEPIEDDQPEALTSAEILDHLRLGLQRRLATAEKEESEEINHRSPKFAPRLLSIFELTERKPREERLGGWKRSVEVLGEEAESSAEDIFSNFSDSELSFTSPPSTPTTGRYSPLFDSASVQSSPASSIVSLPLPAEHSIVAKRLFTSTSVTTTPKVDYRTTSRIPRLTLKSPTSTIGLGLGLSLPHDLRSSPSKSSGAALVPARRGASTPLLASPLPPPLPPSNLDLLLAALLHPSSAELPSPTFLLGSSPSLALASVGSASASNAASFLCRCTGGEGVDCQ